MGRGGYGASSRCERRGRGSYLETWETRKGRKEAAAGGEAELGWVAGGEHGAGIGGSSDAELARVTIGNHGGGGGR
jgi:hypothetical protein